MDTQAKQMARTIYKAWQANACHSIRQGLGTLIQTTYETFLEYAAKAENKALQTLFFSAYGEIKRGGGRLIDEFMQELEQLSKPAGIDTHGGLTTDSEFLSLMSNDSFERALALETVAERVWQSHYETYYGLQQRLGKLTKGHPLNSEEIPAGPRQLAEIFDRCTNAIAIEQQARLALYTLFEDFLYHQVAPLHRELDEKLKTAGILPDLKVHHIKKKSSQPSKPNIQALKQDKPNPEGNSQSVGDAVLTRIRDLLGSQRGDSSGPGSLGTGSPMAPASIATIEDAMQQAGGAPETRLPHQELLEAAPVAAVPAASLIATRDALRQQRQAIKDIVGPGKLGAYNEDTIEIVGRIFEVMLEEEQLPNAAKALLSHLHTPYLRLAIREPELLSDEQHPARKLLDRFVAASIDWIDDRDLEKGLFPWLRVTINALVHEQTLDRALITDTEAALDEQLEELEQLQNRRQDRVVEKERGRSMLEHASNIVQMELQRLQETAGDQAHCQDLLDNTWRSYLTLALLRNQCDVHCSDWQAAQRLGDAVCQCASQRAAGEIPDSEVLDRLSQTLDIQVASLLPENKRWIQQLLDKLSRPAGTTDGTSPTAKATPSRPPVITESDGRQDTLSPEEQDIADKLISLPEGMRIFYKPDRETPGRMLKLAWYNHITRHFLLVDVSGSNQERLALSDLARAIGSGRAVLQDSERPSFFKRALRVLQSLLEKA